jgi:drug/metabolite transporter (DMT)-like permease
VIGGIPVIAGLLIESAPWKPLSTHAAAALTFTIALPMVFCHWAFTRLVLLLPAGIVSIATMLVPVIGVFSGMLILRERPQPADYVALVLIVAALAIVLLRPAALSRPAGATVASASAQVPARD